MKVHALLALSLALPFSMLSTAFAGPAIVLMGDSHTAGKFGRELDKGLRGVEGAKISTYGSCGSSPGSWFNGWVTHCGYFEHVEDKQPRSIKSAPTPKLDTILTRAKPDYTVIALGTNQLKADYKWAAGEVRKLARAQKAKGGKCIWVGPPDVRMVNAAKLAEFYAAIEAVLAEPESACRLIDSRKYTKYPATGGDGIHYDALPGGAAAAWAEGVRAEIAAIVEAR